MSGPLNEDGSPRPALGAPNLGDEARSGRRLRRKRRIARARRRAARAKRRLREAELPSAGSQAPGQKKRHGFYPGATTHGKYRS